MTLSDNRSLALGIFGASLISLAAIPNVRAEDAPHFDIAITDKGCDQTAINAKAGDVSFTITNKSDKAIEWEILDGVKVVFEKENILPNFKQDLKATLVAGNYQMTCGLLSNAQGTLVVAANDAADAKPVVVPKELVAPLAEYKAYILKETNILLTQTTKFVAAVNAGKLAEAQALFGPTRVHYEDIEPVAELFNDLDGTIDTRPDDFEKKEDDPKFVGFHRIEKALFADKTTDGTKELADKLLADVTELHSRIQTLVIPPDKMLDGAAELIEEVAKTKITGEEDRYSGTDLYDFQANVDGSKKIVELIKPLLKAKNPDLLKKTETNFAKVDALLAKYKTANGGFENYSKVTEDDRTALKGPITALAEDLSSLKGVMGIE